MSGFSASWLALREPVDHRSRDASLLKLLAQRLDGRSPMRVLDLGCGTGSNLRATAPRLGDAQEWTLVDYDPALLEEAALALTNWADEAQAIGDQLVLIKDGKNIGVRFRIADLDRELGDVLSGKPDLVTASALFDLISESWMKTFAAALKISGALFYTVLTYDGRDEFLPEHPLDHAVIAAFAKHQTRDKGFGPAAGPRAAAALVRILRAEEFTVDTADSPWVMNADDQPLVSQLLDGVAGAVRETGALSETQLSDWLAFRQKAASGKQARITTGHTDIFAY